MNTPDDKQQSKPGVSSSALLGVIENPQAECASDRQRNKHPDFSASWSSVYPTASSLLDAAERCSSLRGSMGGKNGRNLLTRLLDLWKTAGRPVIGWQQIVPNMAESYQSLLDRLAYSYFDDCLTPNDQAELRGCNRSPDSSVINKEPEL